MGALLTVERRIQHHSRLLQRPDATPKWYRLVAPREPARRVSQNSLRKRSKYWREPLPFRIAARLCWACSCMPMRAPVAARKRCGCSTNFTGGERPVTSRRPRFSKCILSSIPCAATRVSQPSFAARTSNNPFDFPVSSFYFLLSLLPSAARLLTRLRWNSQLAFTLVVATSRRHSSGAAHPTARHSERSRPTSSSPFALAKGSACECEESLFSSPISIFQFLPSSF